MNLIFITGGSRGDVQPYVALANGLRAAGHRVKVLAAQSYQALVEAYGLEFVPTGGDVEAFAQNQMQALAERGNLLEILAATGRGAQQLASQTARAGQEACRGADLIVAGLGGLFIGLALSEKLGIPLLQAHLMPFTPTREFPSVLTPLPQTVLTRWANPASHQLARQMMWQMLRAADNQARTQVLGMARSPLWGPFGALDKPAQPMLYGYSPQVIPAPSDWPDNIHVTGYWFLDPPPGWAPPSDLLAFLAAGPPPVYVGFGSMPNQNPEDTANLVVQALARVGQRGVLSSGWSGLKQQRLPETVFMAGSIPHGWLFPQMAAVVHHGGAGTTGASLRAGVPSIITPFFGDQLFWGQRVYALGVGPRPIPRKQLTVERLAAAIQSAVSDPVMRPAAAGLGKRIAAENGIARAVALIEGH